MKPTTAGVTLIETKQKTELQPSTGFRKIVAGGSLNKRPLCFRPDMWIPTVGLMSRFCCGYVTGQDSIITTNQADVTESKTHAAPALFTQKGTDPAFAEIVSSGKIPKGSPSTEGGA